MDALATLACNGDRVTSSLILYIEGRTVLLDRGGQACWSASQDKLQLLTAAEHVSWPISQRFASIALDFIVVIMLLLLQNVQNQVFDATLVTTLSGFLGLPFLNSGYNVGLILCTETVYHAARHHLDELLAADVALEHSCERGTAAQHERLAQEEGCHPLVPVGFSLRQPFTKEDLQQCLAKVKVSYQKPQAAPCSNSPVCEA